MDRRDRDLYKEAGVDTAKGDRLVDWLKSEQKPTQGAFGSVVSGIGGFAGLFRPDFSALKDPLLVSGTDGVGTKLLLGLEAGRVDGLGQDLVAMCVNDLYPIGAQPLFFLDYYATGGLDESSFQQVVSGIKRACESCDTALLGGETAELPGLYQPGHFDLAGFVVGVVDRERMLGPERVKAGDRLYGFASSGFHSNGYSLVRKWLDKRTSPLGDELKSRLLAPTRIYTEIPRLLDAVGCETLHAVAHVTGGGISGNLPRAMPRDTVCHLNSKALPTPPWMSEFLQENEAGWKDVEGVFNLGVGMIAAIDQAQTQAFEKACRDLGLEAHEMGEVRAGSGEPEVVYDA